MTDYFSSGKAMRERVLGTAHVARSLGATPTVDGVPDLQRLITEFGWGAVWDRPGLPLTTRSLVTVAMLTALNRPHELKLHLRGALNNGCSEAEIRETLLHAIPYCGFPAAIDAVRVFDELLEEIAPDDSSTPS